MADDYYITIPSNASMDLYPANKLSSYKVQLSHPIQLGLEPHEAALTEIHFPNSYESTHVISTDQTEDFVNIRVDKLEHIINQTEIKLAVRQFNSVERLVTHINNKIDTRMKDANKPKVFYKVDKVYYEPASPMEGISHDLVLSPSLRLKLGFEPTDARHASNLPVTSKITRKHISIFETDFITVKVFGGAKLVSEKKIQLSPAIFKNESDLCAYITDESKKGAKDNPSLTYAEGKFSIKNASPLRGILHTLDLSSELKTRLGFQPTDTLTSSVNPLYDFTTVDILETTEDDSVTLKFFEPQRVLHNYNVKLETKGYNTIQDLIDAMNEKMKNAVIAQYRPVFTLSETNLVSYTVSEASIALSESLRIKLGYMGQDATTASQSPVLTYGYTRHIYVYTDLIHPNFIGNSFSPLIRIVQPKQGHLDAETVEFSIRQYYPLRSNILTDIEVELRTDTGRLTPFTSGRNRVVCVFHVRKKAI